MAQESKPEQMLWEIVSCVITSKATWWTETKCTILQKLKLTQQTVVKDNNKRCVTAQEVLKAWNGSIARALSISKQAVACIFWSGQFWNHVLHVWTFLDYQEFRQKHHLPHLHMLRLYVKSAMSRRVTGLNRTSNYFLSIQRNPSDMKTTATKVKIHIHTCITIFMCIYIVYLQLYMSLHIVSYKYITYFFVVIFLPLTILVEVDIDLKLPIPLPPNDVEENEARPPCPSEPNEVKPTGERDIWLKIYFPMIVGSEFISLSDYIPASGCP